MLWTLSNDWVYIRKRSQKDLNGVSSSKLQQTCFHLPLVSSRHADHYSLNSPGFTVSLFGKYWNDFLLKRSSQLTQLTACWLSRLIMTHKICRCFHLINFKGSLQQFIIILPWDLRDSQETDGEKNSQNKNSRGWDILIFGRAFSKQPCLVWLNQPLVFFFLFCLFCLFCFGSCLIWEDLNIAIILWYWAGQLIHWFGPEKTYFENTCSPSQGSSFINTEYYNSHNAAIAMQWHLLLEPSCLVNIHIFHSPFC